MQATNEFVSTASISRPKHGENTTEVVQYERNKQRFCADTSESRTTRDAPPIEVDDRGREMIVRNHNTNLPIPRLPWALPMEHMGRSQGGKEDGAGKM